MREYQERLIRQPAAVTFPHRGGLFVGYTFEYSAKARTRLLQCKSRQTEPPTDIVEILASVHPPFDGWQ